MGYYIQGPTRGKAEHICLKHGAIEVDEPSVSYFGSLMDAGLALICVLTNGLFDAAAVMYSENELQDFIEIDDGRRKTWLLMEKEVAWKLSGCTR